VDCARFGYGAADAVACESARRDEGRPANPQATATKNAREMVAFFEPSPAC